MLAPAAANPVPRIVQNKRPYSTGPREPRTNPTPVVTKTMAVSRILANSKYGLNCMAAGR